MGQRHHKFRALLHFVYVHGFVAGDERANKIESLIVEDLLAAADRFELPELKRIYILSNKINENTVAKMLNLAIQHHAPYEYCIDFLRYHPVLDAVMASDGSSLHWSM
jgi:hypothetical protein